LGGRGRHIPEFKANLVYRVSSKKARTIQRNPVLKKANKQKNQPTNNNKKTKERETGHGQEERRGEKREREESLG
jgi:hypothetical protein